MDAGEIGDQLLALRDDLCLPPDAFTRARHLAAMDAASSTLAPVVGAERRRRPRAVLLVGAATLGVLALTSGLAAAGTLPAPVQRQAARVAHAVGWDIPGHVDPATDEPHGGSSTETRSGTTPQSGRASGSNRGADPSTPSAPAVGTVPVPGPSATAPGPPPSAPVPVPGVPEAPGRSGDAPRPTGSEADAPGSSGSAPGHTDSPAGAPGNSGNAPGHADPGSGAPGKSGSAPGHSGDAPGRPVG